MDLDIIARTTATLLAGSALVALLRRSARSIPCCRLRLSVPSTKCSRNRSRGRD